MITNRWGERGGWGANEMTKGGVTNISHKYLLTSLNLSHLPTSHLSSKKLPLSERAETRPKATAHTHSKATLSICGHTTTTRGEDIGSGWRTPHSRKTPTEALQHASQNWSSTLDLMIRRRLSPTLSHQKHPRLWVLAAVFCH